MNIVVYVCLVCFLPLATVVIAICSPRDSR